ncbi:MAG: (2Fe-2S)-binding protein [Chloroflexota bacterium]|nr:MAG: (2Fe-2S)-binding protein [Chloroflexota bacterium]
MTVELIVNGHSHRLFLEPHRRLLDVLRVDLGLTGTKKVCARGECGACTVLLDGIAVYSCLVLAVECEGNQITTIEGLEHDGELDSLQDAFVQHDGLQCGFCTPGQIMAAKALLAEFPRPSLERVKLGLSGNLCRCGAYPQIFEAVLSVGAGDCGLGVVDRPTSSQPPIPNPHAGGS